jgi:hypothetical protein
MRYRTSMAVTFCVFAAGISVAGCSSNTSSSPAGGSTTSSATPTSSTQAGGATATPSSTQSAQAAGSSGAGGGGTCQPTDLSFALGAKSGATSQQTQVVDLTNKGSSACTMEGFPGVDLVGMANGQQDYTWSLVRKSVGYSQVTLQPGATAHFDLIYLPGSSSGSGDISVDKMVVTPPNDFTQAQVTWNQSVVLQDGATHPGTYISPVVSGS